MIERREFLAGLLGSAGIASLIPGLHTLLPAPNRGVDSVAGVFETGTDAGRRFASVLRDVDVSTRPIARDVSTLWYEHLRRVLEHPTLVLGLTYEPEAFYLRALARDQNHCQICRLDFHRDSVQTTMQPVISIDETGVGPRVRVGDNWPEQTAAFMANVAGLKHASPNTQTEVTVPGHPDMVAWVIAPISARTQG